MLVALAVLISICQTTHYRIWEDCHFSLIMY